MSGEKETMSAERPAPQSMRLSRRVLAILDELVEDLDLRSRNSAVTLLAEWASERKTRQRLTWKKLLLGGRPHR
jgi:hypothetical protein